MPRYYYLREEAAPPQSDDLEHQLREKLRLRSNEWATRMAITIARISPSI